jgi:serine/threonine-protein kinase
MEYLEGQSLAQVMNAGGGRLGLRQTVDVTRQVCTGLQFVHERGCIHRDVKPTNIFVSREGHATLLDFGILVDLGSGSAFSGASLMGTPGYIAPEVVLQETADARSDVYAMGAVIYRMLSGASPWASNTQQVTLDDLLRSPKSLAEVSPNLPKEVCWVVMKSLSREPGLRYSTAKELSDALESAASGTPGEVSLSPSTQPSESPPHTQRLGGTRPKRIRVALMTGVIAVFASIGIVTWSLDRKSATQASPVRLAAKPAPSPIEVSLLPVELAAPAAKPEPRRRAQNEKQGQLRVVSQEKGQATWALVEIDGQPRGGTPLDLELRAGAHRLIVTREGFKRVEKSVTVKPGERSLERIELMPLRQ